MASQSCLLSMEHSPLGAQADFRPGVSNLSTTAIWGQTTVGAGGCPGYLRVFHSCPGLYPLDARNFTSPSPSCDTQKCLYTSPNVPGVAWGG